MSRTALSLAALLSVATLSFGCDSTAPPTRTVTGQLSMKQLQLDNPVVMAQSSDHRVFYTHLSADGSFRLILPTEMTYRLVVANSTPMGAYQAVAYINWPFADGADRWAMVHDGNALDLGLVALRGTTGTGSPGYGIQCDSCDKSGHEMDSCKEDDKAECDHDGHEKDCDCDHKMKDDDKCDHDKDKDKHDKDCDNDDDKKKKDREDGYKCDGGTGMTCLCKYDGGMMISDHEDHDDDDHDGDHHCVCMPNGGGGAKDGGTTPGGGGNPPGGGAPDLGVPPMTGGPGSMCITNIDCQKGLFCVANHCVAVL